MFTSDEITPRHDERPDFDFRLTFFSHNAPMDYDYGSCIDAALSNYSVIT